MGDDEQSTSGTFAGLIEEYFAQLRTVTEGLQSLAGSGPHLLPAPGGLPLPGALSAAQLASIADSIAAQRRSIEALKAQLSSFDEQLAALEQILGPLAQWGSMWAELEQRLLNLPRPPESGGPARSLPGNSAGRGDSHGHASGDGNTRLTPAMHSRKRTRAPGPQQRLRRRPAACHGRRRHFAA
jgi:hypothetical protein